MKNPWVIIGILTVVLFGGAILFSSKSMEKNNEGVEILTHVKGNENSTVTLVEYSDFQCPACAAFQPVVAQILAENGDKIRFEYKHFPIPQHTYANQAAVAAEAAGQQGKFFEFHDLLFANQANWSSAKLPNTFFIQYASDLGLDIEKFKAQSNSSLLRDKVKKDALEGRELEITGTPTFFLNGNKMEFDSYQSFIEQVMVAIDPAFVPVSVDASAPSNGVKFGI